MHVNTNKLARSGWGGVKGYGAPMSGGPGNRRARRNCKRHVRAEIRTIVDGSLLDDDAVPALAFDEAWRQWNTEQMLEEELDRLDRENTILFYEHLDSKEEDLDLWPEEDSDGFDDAVCAPRNAA
jgi:hypothetical protein